jgi:hypothetical protein
MACGGSDGAPGANDANRDLDLQLSNHAIWQASALWQRSLAPISGGETGLMSLRNPDFDTPFGKYSFYHCIEVAPGMVTPGHTSLIPLQAPIMKTLRTLDVRGKRVIGIGCRDGMFSFEAERMGAAEVVGIDNDLSTAAVEFLIPHFKSSVKMRSQNLYDLVVPEDHRYDLAIFAGVLYHLREPFLGLRRISEALNDGGTVLLETGIIVNNHDHAMLHCPDPKDSPYEPTSVTFFNHKGLCAALASFGFTGIQCRALLIGDTVFDNYEAFYAAHPTYTEAKDIITARGTYTAKASRSLNADLQRYWYGTHSLNSDATEVRRFLDEHNL